MSARPRRSKRRAKERIADNPQSKLVEFDAQSVPQKQDGVTVETNVSSRLRAGRKRAKASASMAKMPTEICVSLGGEPKDLLDMPLDIWFEVFARLLPEDLLHLARTSKPLRSFLMQRSCAYLWKNAFCNLPIPPPACPTDLLEPQWANLLFDTCCSFCSNSSADTVLWAFRVRCCEDCLANSGEFVTCFSLSLREFRYDRFELWLDSMPGASNSDIWRPFRTIYRLSQAKELFRQHAESVDKTAFMREKLQIAYGLRVHADLCRAWQKDMAEHRLLQLERDREKRRTIIFELLTDLGWGEVIEMMTAYATLRSRPHPLSEHLLVKQSEYLSGRSWNEIKPILVDFLQAQKDDHIKTPIIKERLDIFRSVIEGYSRQHHREILPPTADIYEMDGVKVIIEADSKITVTPESFAHIIEALPQFAEDWRRARTIEFMELLPPSQGGLALSPDDISRMYLATNAFICNLCDAHVTFPRLLAHACLRKFRDVRPLRDDRSEDHYLLLGSQPWYCGANDVIYDKHKAWSANWIVEQCGLNPDVTMSSAMEGIWVECHTRWSDASQRVVMSYATAVACSVSSFSILGEHDSSEAIKASKLDSHCSQCGLAIDTSVLISHLQESHDMYVKHIKQGEHFYLAIDSPPPGYVILPVTAQSASSRSKKRRVKWI